MSNIITINDLQFDYKNRQIFDNFNLEIKYGDFVSLIGPNGSGKTTLVKILTGLVSYKGNVVIDGLLLDSDNIKKIRQLTGVVLGDISNQIMADKVFDNIAFSLVNLGYTKNEIVSKVNNIVNMFDIGYLLNQNISNLTNFEKSLVNLAAVLVNNPKLLILDESFLNYDKLERDRVFKVLKKLNIDSGLTIINITQNIDDILFGNSVIVLDNGKIVKYGSNAEIFESGNLLTKLGLNLPFMVDLSIKLKYYNLIDEIIYDMDEMVDTLWK